MFDWSNYRGNLDWLQKQTILMVRHGSHCYGLNIATSDEDFKGVAVPPSRYRNGFVDRFEQAESKDPDFVVYDVIKFMKLAADANPSILEVLFIDDENLLSCTPQGQMLRDARDQFLSKKVRHTYAGYAHQQLRRIKLHRSWNQKVMKAPPTRSELGLPERTLIPKDQLAAAMSMIREKLNSWVIDNLDEVDDAAKIAVQTKMTDIMAEMHLTADETTAARALGFSDNFIHLLDLERRYKAGQQHYQDYLNWKATRNPKRAELEAKFGFDVKHGMHLTRLHLQCKDVLSTGSLQVRSPYRDLLLSIRNGGWTYEQLVEFAEKAEAELPALEATSLLPKAPDRAKLSQLCESIVESML